MAFVCKDLKKDLFLLKKSSVDCNVRKYSTALVHYVERLYLYIVIPLRTSNSVK